MKEKHLDAVVTEWALARIQRPDFLAVMGQRGGDADAQRLALLDEIEGHRAYLDSVREQAAARQRLDLLLDQSTPPSRGSSATSAGRSIGLRNHRDLITDLTQTLPDRRR